MVTILLTFHDIYREFFMRWAGFVLIVTFTLSSAQQRFLVSPHDEVIPLKRGESAIEAARQHGLRKIFTHPCDSIFHFTFGYPEYIFPANINLPSYHKDVIGEWFVAKASGSIDTIFWESVGRVGSLDSVVKLRINKSNIYPGRGPGYGPYPPPCIPWGYYTNTNDHDQYITPYRDEATDTTWISTVPGDSMSFDPLGPELWGVGGYPLIDHANSINYVALEYELGYKPHIKTGDAFFITFRVNSRNDHPITEEPTDWATSAFHDDPTDENYPSRIWKFYEHKGNVSSCYGRTVTDIPHGWVARGGFSSDTLDVAVFDIWYVMTVDSINNLIVFPGIDSLYFVPVDPDSLRLCFDVCNPTFFDSVSASLYVDDQWVYRWQITADNNAPYCFTFLKPSLGSSMEFFFALYEEGHRTLISYSVQLDGLSQNGYTVDTATAFDWNEIDASGTQIQSTSWFLRPDATSGACPPDDGTAGPFDLGFDFNFFGDNLRYAWIGVNGAMALSATITDTIHLNDDSFFANWTIPGKQTLTSGVPRNFIAPFWFDFALPPCALDGGKIYHKNENSKFIVEWNSVWPFNSPYNPSTFEVILDPSDSSLTYLYKDVDLHDAPQALIGFEADTSHWFVLPSYGYPLSAVPQNNKAFKFRPNQTIVGIKDDKSYLPNKFKLYQNYPNPFNPTTEIRFQVAEAGVVTLKVFDVLGRAVATLVNEKKQPGEYNITWDAGSLPSGVYFYRLQTAKFPSVRKMLLIR